MTVTRYAFVNGDYVDDRLPLISAYDSALATGDVVTEVVRTYRQQPFKLDQHLGRLLDGLRELEIPCPLGMSDLIAVTHELLRRNARLDPYAVDWQFVYYVSRGFEAHFGIFEPASISPTVIILCFPLDGRLARLCNAYDHGVDVIVPPQRGLPTNLVSAHIKSRGSLHFRIAKLQAQRARAGAWALLVDPENNVLEGTGWNVFIVSNGCIRTPPQSCVLAGITRDVVISIAEKCGIPVAEEVIQLDAALRAEEMFMTSTVIGILHAKSFAEKTLGTGRIGDVSRVIRSAFSELAGVDIVDQAHLAFTRIQARG